MKHLSESLTNESVFITELSDMIFDYIVSLNNDKEVEIFKNMLYETVEYALEMHPDKEAVSTSLEKLAKKLK